MKVLIVSDIHGNYLNMKKVIENNPNYDYIFIIGDILSGPYIDGYNPEQLVSLLNIESKKIFAVKGNCDGYSNELLDFDTNKICMSIPIDKMIFLMSHGHMYNRYQLPELPFDIFIQGHTHIPMMEVLQSKLYLNPGSITLPRGGSVKSYIYYDNHNFFLKEVDTGKIIKKINF